ncbi:MAG: HD domain-containing phosphohydrolase [Thermodesulfobacteriota bacterium]
MENFKRLIEIITDIAGNRYHNDILELTGPDTAEPVRTIALAVSRMMTEVTAREDRLEAMTRQLEEANREIRRNIIATVSTMARALAARDAYTEGHAERVGRISGLIAAEMGLNEQDTELVHLAGLLHDIGKIGFPDSLFLPHGGSNSSEVVREITRHPVTGAEILKNLNFLGPAVTYVRCHHERPDGKGYPEGLTAADIPLGAKIIAVADTFDAMTTDRPYQKARTFAEAIDVLKAGAGDKWDRECVVACERVLPKIPIQGEAGKGSREKMLYLSEEADIVLEPGPPGGARMRWIKPGTDFSRYGRFLLDPVIFFFAPDSEYKGMDPRELKSLADLFVKEIRSAFKGKYPIVNKPAPDVARLRVAITDLRQNRPDPGEGQSRDGSLADLETGLMNSWAGSGATCAEFMVVDSMTGNAVVAAKDDRSVGLREKFTRWGSVEDAFKHWAARIRLVLDLVHEVKAQGPAGKVKEEG